MKRIIPSAVCLDGFPFGKYDDILFPFALVCDACGTKFDIEDDEAFLAKSSGDNLLVHQYAFCCYQCACDFIEKHRLVIYRINDSRYDFSFTLDPTKR